MVVDDADALQIGIDDRRADKFEPALFEFRADLFRKRVFGRHILCAQQMVVYHLAARKSPYKFIETAERFLHFQKGARIRDRRPDFAAVADNALVPHQFLYLLLAVICNDLWVESVERAAEILLFVQDQIPAHARLHALQHEHSEKLPVPMFGLAPPRVMVAQDFFGDAEP